MDHELYSCSCGFKIGDIELFFRHVYSHMPKNHDNATRLMARIDHGKLIIVPACECEICRPAN